MFCEQVFYFRVFEILCPTYENAKSKEMFVFDFVSFPTAEQLYCFKSNERKKERERERWKETF